MPLQMQSSFEKTRRLRHDYLTRGFRGAFTAPRKTMSQAFLYSIEQDEGQSMFLGLLVAAGGLVLFAGVLEAALDIVFGHMFPKPIHFLMVWGSLLPCLWLLWKAHERWGFHTIKHKIVSELRAWRLTR